MSIRYHLIYYAIALFLLVLSMLNYIFIFLFLFYLYFFISKTSFISAFLFIVSVLLILIFKPQYDLSFHSIIEGKVIEAKDNYCIVSCDHQNVKVYHQESFEYGDEVQFKIKQLTIQKQKNDYGYDEEIYFLSHDIQIKASLVKVLKLEHKDNFVSFIEKRLSHNEKTRSYQRLFLLGVKDKYIEDDYHQLLNLSIIHLFALSGMHLSYLKKLLRQLLSFFIQKNYCDWIVYIFLFYYITHIPYSISLFRAFYMLVLYELFKEYLNMLDIYSIVFIFFLLKNPYYLYNYSFLFSFGIYFFVLLCKDIKYSEFYVYLFSIPFLIYTQNKINIFSLLFSMCLTLFVELFYEVIILSTFLPFIELPLSIMVSLLNKMIQFTSLFDSYIIFRNSTLSFIIIFYYIAAKIIMKRQLQLKCLKEHSLIIALMIAFLIYGKYPLYATVTMIDVGQGDCCLIRLPFFQGSVLIDTGGDRNYDIATTTLIPYFHSIGLDSLDYVYISHNDYDHCGALESLEKNFNVKHVIKQYEEKRQIGDLTIEMLNTHKTYSSSNDQSLLMKLKLYGYHFLFMGDASIEVEKDLLEQYQHIDIHFLKVSHHGSQTSSGVELFELIQPQIAMISVKKNNLYKHPSDKVIKRLKRKGIMILRTDEIGMFHLCFYKKLYYIFE